MLAFPASSIIKGAAIVVIERKNSKGYVVEKDGRNYRIIVIPYFASNLSKFYTTVLYLFYFLLNSFSLHFLLIPYLP